MLVGMTTTLRPLAVAFSTLLLGACAADVDSDEGVASTGGEQAALHSPSERPDRLERRLDRMKARLDLTDDQVEQLRPLLERMRSERQALRELPRDERREAARTLRDTMRTELEGILTPDQMERAERMFERHHRRGRHHRGHGRFRGPPDPDRMLERMSEHLDLTEEQAELVRPILEGAHERRQSLRDLPRDERREAARALHEEVQGELAQVLTEEQQAKMREHFERRHHRFERGRRGPRGHRGGPGGADAPTPGPRQAL